MSARTITIHPDIVTIGDPFLKLTCHKVENLSLVREHCQKMVSLLRELKGAGLAAPQIGLLERIIVVEVRKTELFPDRPESPLYVMINPEIVEASLEVEDGWEGCFSVPAMVGLVPRSKKITVKYQSEDGKHHLETFEGYLARVIQHECDHLDGQLYLEKMRDIAHLSTVENYRIYQHQSSLE
jgi:peptide deformylase